MMCRDITKRAILAFQISFHDSIVIKLTFVAFLNHLSYYILSFHSSTVWLKKVTDICMFCCLHAGAQ